MYTISGGTIVGGQNQFHSFSEFNLTSLETADFTGPAGIQNILSRISGGQSSINGIVRSSIAGADLWIINPNGVLFGASASLDLSGSLHVSSADYLLLEGGGQFFADPATSSILTVGNPTTFGFLQTPAGSIVLDDASLSAPQGETITLIGREVRLQGAGGSTVSAPGGRINLTSVGSSGEVTLQPDGIDIGDISYATPDGERVSMVNGSTLDVSDAAGGSIFIRGGRFLMTEDEANQEILRADSTGAGSGGSIDIQMEQEIGLRGELSANSLGSGSGGDIRLAADSISMSDQDSGIGGQAIVETRAESTGSAGSVFMDAASIQMDARVRVSTTGSGDAGDIVITGGSLNINSTDAITSSTSGAGNGGNIVISLSGDLTIQDGNITAETSGISNGGNAGDISIQADSISATNSFAISTSTSNDGGAAGDLLLDAASSISLDAGFIRAETSSASSGGSITLSAPLIDLFRNPAVAAVQVSSTASGTGSAGHIDIIGDQVSIRDEATITATTVGPGDAGDISIAATSLFDLVGPARIESRSIGPNSGSAGNISVNGGTVRIRDGTSISVSTTSGNALNNAGSIGITASGELTVDNGDLSNPVLLATTGGAADGGDIRLNAADLRVESSLIQASTDAAGNAGDIALQGSTTLNILDTIVEAGTRASGNGGSILIDGGALHIEDADLLVNSLGGATGRAGDILATVGQAGVIHSFIEAETSGDGDGGSIGIQSAGLLSIGGNASGNSILSTRTTGGGNSGAINLFGAGVLLDGAVIGSASDQISSTPSGAAGSVAIGGDTVQIIGGASVSVSTSSTDAGNAVGSIDIAAGDLLSIESGDLINPVLAAITSGAAGGGSISLRAADLQLTDSLVQVSTSGTGTAGNISLTGTASAQVRGAVAEAGTNSSGDGGSILLDGGTFRLEDARLAASSAGDSGHAGSILATVTQMDLIHTEVQAETTGPGGGGDINLASTGSLSLSGNLAGDSRLTARTTGSGNGGSIGLSGTVVLLDSTAIDSESIQGTGLPSGAAGAITITGDAVLIGEQATISVTTSSAARDNQAGSIDISASDTLVIRSGDPGIAALSATTSGAAGGGSITLTAPDLQIDNTAIASESIQTPGVSSGTAGAISLSAGNVFISGGSTLSVRTASTSPTITAGSIGITADELLVLEDSHIEASTSAAGSAGDISLNGVSSVSLLNSNIEAGTTAAGNGGSIQVDASTLLLDGATISSRSLQNPGSISGAAGSISFAADDIFVFGGSDISVSTASNNAANPGGSIDFTATESLVVDNGDPFTPFLSATTSGAAPGGGIRLTANDLLIGNALVQASTSAEGMAGDIDLSGATSVTLLETSVEAGTSATGNGGSIFVNTNELFIEDSLVLADSTGGPGQAGSIIATADEASLIHALLTAETSGSGTGGSIVVLAGNQLSIGGNAAGGSVLTTRTTGTGDSGTIDLFATTLLVDGSTIASQSAQGPGAASGAAGSLSLGADNLSISSGSLLSVSTESAASNNVRGSIDLAASETLTIAGGASGMTAVSATTSGAAPGGNIALTATDIHLEGVLVQASTSASGPAGDIAVVGTSSVQLLDSIVEASTGSSGAGGSVVLLTDALEAGEGSQISTATGGSGAGGDVLIEAVSSSISGEIIASTSGSGNGGEIHFDASLIEVQDNAAISVRTDGDGAGGSMEISADRLTLSGAGQLVASATGNGQGGTIRIDADNLVVQHEASISAGTSGSGDGGSISINADDLEIAAGRISASTDAGSSGTGGDISITGSTLLLISGGEIAATTSGSGNGGSINILVQDLEINTQGRIAVGATGSGDGGGIRIRADSLIDMEDASVASDSNISNGGDIFVSAGDVLLMLDSNITTSANAIDGNAGDIQLGNAGSPSNPVFLIIQGDVIRANAGASGGSISLYGQYILGSQNIIEAISDSGNDGEVIFDVPVSDLVGVISVLDLPILGVDELLDDQCAVSALSERSSFIVEGSDIRPSPDAYISSGYYLPAATTQSSIPGPGKPPAPSVRSVGC